MLMTKLKSKETIASLASGKVFIVNCHGCKEVGFPEQEAEALQKELAAQGKVVGSLTTDYICNPDELRLRLRSCMAAISEADAVLVFSCGVGVQTISQELEDMKVYACCDTIELPGFQGVTPLNYCLLQEPGQRSLRRHQKRQVRGLPRYGVRLGADYSALEGAGSSGRAEMQRSAP